jgi:hypothetical protein
MVRQDRWFKPGKETGWRKGQKPLTRRRHLMGSTDKRKSFHDRRIEAARRANALANVTRDRPTARAARSDARHFYRSARRLR